MNVPPPPSFPPAPVAPPGPAPVAPPARGRGGVPRSAVVLVMSGAVLVGGLYALGPSPTPAPAISLSATDGARPPSGDQQVFDAPEARSVAAVPVQPAVQPPVPAAAPAVVPVAAPVPVPVPTRRVVRRAPAVTAVHKAGKPARTQRADDDRKDDHEGRWGDGRDEHDGDRGDGDGHHTDDRDGEKHQGGDERDGGGEKH